VSLVLPYALTEYLEIGESILPPRYETIPTKAKYDQIPHKDILDVPFSSIDLSFFW
jgi:hypothetical protein